MKLKVYGDIVSSSVDGPGTRAVVHLAGCSLRCPGCFNQDLWNPSGARVRTVGASRLAEELLVISQSVTISGGEPTDQLIPLVGLLRSLRRMGCDDIVMFTGRRLGALRRIAAWSQVENQKMLDVLIDGRFRSDLIETQQVLRGSTNQRIHRLTDRWTLADFESREVEVHMTGDDMIVTGFPESELMG